MPFVIDFFKGAYIPKEISATTLMFIPKIQEARHLGDYCPISLVNFATHLPMLLLGIINEEQAGFVQGRHIATYIALAQELVRDLLRIVPSANVVFKMDMAKAYDRLEWRFLLKARESFVRVGEQQAN